MDFYYESKYNDKKQPLDTQKENNPFNIRFFQKYSVHLCRFRNL